MSNQLIKKIVYCIQISLASPLCVAAGDGEFTDNDVIVNGEGMPFVPGTSLAGAMRNYLAKGRQEDCIFGAESLSDASSKMSSVFVSDLLFDGNVKTVIRDGVALSAEKTAISGAKYDMEVIDTGATGKFWLELSIRTDDREEEYIEQLHSVLAGWTCGDIRLGSKKTRGYGKLEILSVKQKIFTKDNILEYREVYRLSQLDTSWNEVSDLSEASSRYIHVQVPLKLEGGISIRQYQAKKNEPDFVHITANGKPVIPGTSFAGAIRHRMSDILLTVQAQNAESVLNQVFGYVNQDGAKISDVVIGECVIEDSQRMNFTRNSISRFEGGTKSGALFSELTYVGGHTVLDIRVKQSENAKAIVGLLLLVLKDVQNGFLAVGGQTSIGRGLFTADGPISISGDAEEKEYLEAAFCAVERG